MRAPLLPAGASRSTRGRRGPGARAADARHPPPRARSLAVQVGDPALRSPEWDFVAARRRLEEKPKSAGEKITSLDDAAARVSDGDRVAVGGCLFSRTSLALVREILRARRRGLTL